MALRKDAVTAARLALSDLLPPLGFEARGDLLVRAMTEVSQVACACESRFGGAGVSAAWIEVLLLHGPLPTRVRRFGRLQGSANAIASLRFNEIAPDAPPYYMLGSPADFDRLHETIVADLQRSFVPFLQATRDVSGVIERLSQFGSTRALQLAVLCARIGDRKRSQAFFRAAEGDREAIRRVASSHGVELDEN